MKYKIGDVVICVKNEELLHISNSVGWVGKITHIDDTDIPYCVIFDKDLYQEEDYKQYLRWFRERHIRPINAIKLKKILEE